MATTEAWTDNARLGQLLQTLGANYTSQCEGANSQALLQSSGTVDTVLASLSPDTFTCLVCIDEMGSRDAIWSCPACYRSQHLNCLLKWIRSSAIHAGDAAEANGDSLVTGWTCPNCRGQFANEQAPTRYTCYCGKLTDPPFDPWLLPHSCGELCDKPLSASCGHKCLMLCHPGRCPPCPRAVQTKCHCGRVQRSLRCGETWSCSAKCNKSLCSFGHRCQLACHPDSCGQCQVPVVARCQCGQLERKLLCHERSWQCDKVCGQQLDCGKHWCQRVCHAGQCGQCPTAAERRCPCGKRRYAQLDCTEEAPTCSDTCGKLLQCGQHRCPDQCHKGDCPPCREMVMKQCRCGSTSKQIQCHRTFTCDTKCQLSRNCGRHQCKRRCCQGNCLPCELICNRPLRCGQHKCQSQCHTGQCYPCTERLSISCACGHTSISYACGSRSKPRLPRCQRQCTVPPDCDHAERQQHLCHTGQCPPCKLICDAPLGCGHRCQEVCHTAKLVTVNRQVKGQWDGPQTVLERKRLPCPPCSVSVQLRCYGGHELLDSACSDATVRSCGRLCAAPMSCGRHQCQLVCHEISKSGSANDPRHQCEQLCQQPRPSANCKHRCQLTTCHSGDCPPCQLTASVRCHCGASKLKRICSQLAQASGDELADLLRCAALCTKRLKCGHPHSAPCHPGECISTECQVMIEVRCRCKRKQKQVQCSRMRQQQQLECDDKCEQLLLERRQAEGSSTAEVLKLKKKKKEEEEEEEQQLLRRLPQQRAERRAASRQQRLIKQQQQLEEQQRLQNNWQLRLKSIMTKCTKPAICLLLLTAIVCLVAWAAMT